MHWGSMRVLIVTDIFGITAAVLSLASSLRDKQVHVEVVEPYDGTEKSFIDDQSAYETFLANCGHDRYFRKVKNVISSSLEELVIIGFSAGASAAWRTMELDWQPKLLHFIGFYPGQIRNYLDITPKYPCTIVLPNREEHFSVSEVSSVLKEIDNVHCIHTELGHGFMNPLSYHFSNAGADAFNKVINQASKLADVATLRRLLQR
ncbi:dienelactone hydrolase family protein [Zobellella sp. DQSA1]|uniref:dienelactone hydrolase family protein n=1 Tax=Zobellella sp. DQSA1 TaxID=3342386 RepID=UPI0035BF9BC9